MSFDPVPDIQTVTPDMFLNKIVPDGVPVILRGVAKHWNSVQMSGNPSALKDYIQSGAARSNISVMRADETKGGRFFYSDDMRGFNFQQGEMPFAQFLDRLQNNPNNDAIYMGSTPVTQGFPGLQRDFDMPLVPGGTEPRLWIGNRTVVSTHHDGSSNIACVVAGKRTFTLFAPDQVSNLYPGPIEHTMAGPQVSLVDLENPDLSQYPRYSDALKQAQTATLEPGDALYIPPLWWHHVRALDDFNMLVNFWWRDRPHISREPMEAFVLSLLSLRQLPEPERAAWRAMFDYFVFQTDGPPMEHLADELRGVLGPINPQRAKMIWHYFTDMMKNEK